MKLSVARLIGALLLAIPIAGIGGCGASGPQFHASYAPEYAPGSTVSVFGVFADGRMDPEFWNDLGSTLLPLAGCTAGYSADLATQNPGLASAVDDYVRANGVTEALLAQWGTLSKADTILLFSIAGHPPVQTGPTVVTPKYIPPTQMTRPANLYDEHRPTDGSVFQVTASLYSVRARRSIARLDMIYSERDVDGALREFGRRMRVELPIAACAGWSADTHGLDESKIRELKE
jgi:hypothetical protein